MGHYSLIHQSMRYRQAGVGLGGAILKHSFVPQELLRQVLPERGLILDLGSGEGMLGNLVARALPGARLQGIDLDQSKIDTANRAAAHNASFQVGDILSCSLVNAQAAIFNDVLHHYSTPKQREFLAKAAELLDESGVLVLKEVDARDAADRLWTKFWDNRLYPDDVLNFHTVDEWRELIAEANFELLRIERVKHPWPASRTIFVCRKNPPAKKFSPDKTRISKNQDRAKRELVLVTGASGFLGGHLVEHLLQHGLDRRSVEVVVLARNPARLSPTIRQHCRILNGGLEDLAQHRQELAKVRYVFHLAADKDFFGGDAVFKRNLSGTQAIIDALGHAPKLKRVVFASSMGAVDRAKSDSCLNPIDIHTPAYPSSAYGKAKLESEKLFEQSSLPYVLMRLPWCYGPGMSAQTHVRSLLTRTMKKNLATRINWPGRVSILEATECARSLAFVATHPQAVRRVFYVCDGKPISFGELFTQMGRTCGVSAGQINIPPSLVKMAKTARGVLPFTLRSLLEDVLWVDDSALRDLGFVPNERDEQFLIPLARWMNDRYWPANHRSAAAVTGAASGIGRELAIQLAASGKELLISDRSSSVIDLAEKLPGAEAVVADLTRAEDLERLAQRLAQKENLSWLINNAGLGVRAPVSAEMSAKTNELIDVNVRAVTRLTEAALKRFCQTGFGVVINVASSVAFQPIPGMAAYGASKAYVLSLSEAAAAELRQDRLHRGVAMITACPGGVATTFQASAGVKQVSGEKLLSPIIVARTIMRSAQNARSRTMFIGQRGFYMSMLARVLPRSANASLWAMLMAKAR